jgi:hypothetical protein
MGNFIDSGGATGTSLNIASCYHRAIVTLSRAP